MLINLYSNKSQIYFALRNLYTAMTWTNINYWNDVIQITSNSDDFAGWNSSLTPKILVTLLAINNKIQKYTGILKHELWFYVQTQPKKRKNDFSGFITP